jgi:DNA-binding PadR family transcriptional regulator
VRAEALKGHLDAVLLAALADGPQHGYAIMERLREGSAGQVDLPTGTVYPALHRLARAGLITSNWSTVSGRRRRSYELTDAGRRALASERASWRDFAKVMSALIDRPPAPSPT